MASILGIGECMIELSSAGENLWRQGFAGDVFNTLWYTRALSPTSNQVAFYTALGTDPTSDDMVAFFDAAGVSCADIPRIAGRVPGLYSIHLNGAERSFTYWRDTSAARLMLQMPDLLWNKSADADLVYMSGITLAILPDEDVQVLISGLRAHMKPGAKLAFDPNIRPHLWDNADRMKRVISAAAGISDIVLPSLEDEAETFGDASPKETAARYQSLGAGQVIVKNAQNPTLVQDGTTSLEFPVSFASGVVDTTAAGDSFNGGYFAALMAGHDLPTSIALAQTCAARVVCTKGALMPHDALADLRI